MKKMNLRQTQEAIIFINNTFTSLLSKKLKLQKIVGPLIVDPQFSLNDNLTGNNLPISFYSQYLNKNLEVVQSLAKWKRYALMKYQFNTYEGLYVDMKAIRSHENLDPLHSLYVDQWDWEMIIQKSDRNIDFLKKIVNKIYKCLVETEDIVNKKYSFLSKKLVNKVKFFSSQEIEDEFGSEDFEKSVDILTKKYGSIFVYQIGGKLKSGKIFDSRSYEYDDWNLNGDLFVYSKVIDKAIEISSMGIRVDKKSLISQGNIDVTKEISNNYHQLIIKNKLPLTIGGGIGQSRVNMFLLEKQHIGEVQVSVWADEINNKNNKKSKIEFL